MSLKAELETWAAALHAYEEEDFEKALDLFSRIADSSKILTNMGLIYATLGEHEAAVEQFHAATSLDQYLAVAYFQCGVSNFLLGRHDLSLHDFDEALLYLRGNQAINYEQLGLKFKLFSAEVLFNKGLSQIYLGQVEEGILDLEEARKEKATEEHNVIDDAITDRGEGYTVFSIPVGVLYRPSEQKLKNAKTKDYMGKARLVAALDANEAYTTFTGVTRLQRGQTPSGALLDRPVSEPSQPESTLTRSVTVPPPRNDPIDPKPTRNLERSKTTINVASNARERVAGAGSDAGRSVGGLSRSITSVRPDRSASGAAPVKALSVRRPSRDDTQGSPLPPPPPPDRSKPAPRLTEIYDDYMNGAYEEAPPVPAAPQPQGQPPARVAAWARSNANPANAAPSRAGSTRVPPSSYAYAPSASGSAQSGLRRKLSRRPTANSRGPSRVTSTYEEEEEGYASGDYEDAGWELVKIRVKLHYQEDIRGMTLTPETQFDEFMERVTQKFSKSFGELSLKFKDEDGGKVSLRDDSDFELALETVREMSQGKPEGKLEIWVVDA